MNLSEIREIVKRRWKFTVNEYPGIAVEGLDTSFARTHILKHLVKSVGKMAEIEEAIDHRKNSPQEFITATADAKDRMRILIGKMLGNLMQLAESYGITDAELKEYIRHEK